MLLLPFLSLLISCVYADVNNSSNTSHSYLKTSLHDDEITRRLSRDTIQGIRKMSSDEGEKFFLSYYNFAGSTDGNSTLSERDLDPKYEYPLLARSFPFQSALEKEGTAFGLETRDFKCPTGTNACTSIGRSNRCCSTGSTCEIVTDIGSGDVGCCPAGELCSGTVGSCASGYATCSETLGGGCCIPGYECVSGGCAYISVVTITVDSSVVVSTETFSTIPQSTHSTHSTTSTSTSTESSKTETTDSLSPPARPTSLSTTTHSTTSRVDICPTGFYACSAVYHGGCCQTGRDCDTTSCPTTSSTTFTSDGVTIVEPVVTGSSDPTGKCANGWFSCADTVGGGCCPSGYACGQSCTATAAHSTVAKEQATATSSGSRVEVHLSIWVFAIILCTVWI